MKFNHFLQSFPDNQHAEELIAMKKTCRANKSQEASSGKNIERKNSSSSSEVSIDSILCIRKDRLALEIGDNLKQNFERKHETENKFNR